MDIKSMIDHTLLKADSSKEEITILCEEAKKYEFAAVCVNPYYVAYCADLLKDSGVKVATVIGFPLGANTKESKVFETIDAVNKGAREIDMVINIAGLKNKNYQMVKDEINAVVKAAGHMAAVKVIIETSLLSHEEKIKACELALEAGAHFVKTSTGFSTGGASVEDVRLMKSIVGDKMEVKASGGIRDIDTAKMMIEAGASRLGTSSGVKIVEGN